ncbi:hypothetical protein L249_7611 [Ophiocordyceps polyrhachis-furcata BCC 54312]|uniref:Uncharacterized protein n=1 Tax=Ophiocordyceps polyrhachis-furcata BCC 54312 TaxID=1330021 RepID=A0A367LBF4_9HYPO|nr:hypothetical protein L249_7611 [Ophiocordyceps polyrhachis-furcata BCC 54312]
MLQNAALHLQRTRPLLPNAITAQIRRRHLRSPIRTPDLTDDWRWKLSPYDNYNKAGETFDEEPSRNGKTESFIRAIVGRGWQSEGLRRTVSQTRSPRLNILLLQMLFRNNALEYGQLLQSLLPSDEEWEAIVESAVAHGHTRESLHDFHFILSGRTDEERCGRLLEVKRPVPEFLFKFLLRKSSQITNLEMLDALIEASPVQFWDEKPWCLRRGDSVVENREKALIASQHRFSAVALPLAMHAFRLEPRLIIKIARVAVRYIEDMSPLAATSRRIFNIQCRVFNRALSLTQPRAHQLPIHRRHPNAYFWEAQRIILEACRDEEKPPLVVETGFRAIRSVLAGMAHDVTDARNVKRHAASWPPYLRPADGIDEEASPQASWSRSVSAGALMQEAGFAMTDEDDALDVLQGRATDGTPTIRQRSSNHEGYGVWTASIRATRNATEAWARFLNPPHPGMEPGLPQYTIMFHKLTLRDVKSYSTTLPGHKALNFPTKYEAQLTRFERARVRPPSMAELYRQMMLRDIRPQGTCLRILVANADSLTTAHQYLVDSTEDADMVQCLTAPTPDVEGIRKIPKALFAAYMQACTQVPPSDGHYPLKRAMRLASMELDPDSRRWTPHIWGIVLRGLSRPKVMWGDRLGEHMRIAHYVMDRIEESNGMSVSAFVQFCKCIRKVMGREMPRLLEEVKAAEMEREWEEEEEEDGRKKEKKMKLGQLVPGMDVAVRRMKTEFRRLVERERVSQGLLGEEQPVTGLDRMLCRTDAVSGEQQHEYVLALAYTGEVEEAMATLRWTVAQWGQAEVTEQMAGLEEAPSEADFYEAFCAFRYLVEPLVAVEEAEALRREVEAMGWPWPDEEAAEAYEQLYRHRPTREVRSLLEAMAGGGGVV